MKIVNFLLTLVISDSIGFNRYRNNLGRHIEGRTKPEPENLDFYLLQVIVAKIAQCDTKSLKFAKKLMAHIDDAKLLNQNRNRRLTHYLNRLH